MYEYLSPGTVRRTFTDGNISAINTDADRFMKVEMPIATGPGVLDINAATPQAALTGPSWPASTAQPGLLAPSSTANSPLWGSAPALHGAGPVTLSPGDDVLVGGAGNDLLVGAAGRDLLVGGFASDHTAESGQGAGLLGGQVNDLNALDLLMSQGRDGSSGQGWLAVRSDSGADLDGLVWSADLGSLGDSAS
jgi:hypothetical protein